LLKVILVISKVDFCFYFDFFETWSHYVARLALNFPPSCLSLLSAGIIGVYHHSGHDKQVFNNQMQLKCPERHVPWVSESPLT
jgi:hypothetical protein